MIQIVFMQVSDNQYAEYFFLLFETVWMLNNYPNKMYKSLSKPLLSAFPLDLCGSFMHLMCLNSQQFICTLIWNMCPDGLMPTDPRL